MISKSLMDVTRGAQQMRVMSPENVSHNEYKNVRNVSVCSCLTDSKEYDFDANYGSWAPSLAACDHCCLR